MKTVLEQALEALEYHTAQTRPIAKTNEAIAALKEAIKQQEVIYSGESTTVAKSDANNYCEIIRLLGMEEEGDPIAAIQSLLATKQGEPVGEVVNSGASWDQIVLVKFAGEVRPALGTKLYTSAPTIPEGWQLVPIEPTTGE